MAKERLCDFQKTCKSEGVLGYFYFFLEKSINVMCIPKLQWVKWNKA